MGDLVAKAFIAKAFIAKAFIAKAFVAKYGDDKAVMQGVLLIWADLGLIVAAVL